MKILSPTKENYLCRGQNLEQKVLEKQKLADYKGFIDIFSPQKGVFMNQISELKEILGGFLFWNKARLDCFAKMLLALFAVRTVNLRELAVAFSGKADIDSRYKRLKRFFAQFNIDRDIIARWVFKLFFSESTKIYLTIDRTNWCWGKSKINILMLAIAYEGMAIPLFWKILDKAGNASAEEHKNIIKKFVEVFGKECILGVMGDREFASGKLFAWFNKQNIPFYIRIKENSHVFIGKKKLGNAKKLFKDLNPKAAKPFMMTVNIFKQTVYLAGSRSERGELMIVATNRFPMNAIPLYLRRWEIECLFQGLKGRGFRFEETRLCQPEKIEKLMVLLAIGFCWAHKIGEWRSMRRPIIFNKYRTSIRPQFSYFRYGFDLIREAILQNFRWRDLRNFLKHITLPQAQLEGIWGTT